MPKYLDQFIEQHVLPSAYLATAERYFEPVAKAMIEFQSSQKRPVLVGLNGSQGSGKTTLGDFLRVYLEAQGLNVLSLSLDDFYFSKEKRLELARDVHPLLKTRGVPGSHDVAMLKDVLLRLKNKEVQIPIPRFDKSIDDCVPQAQWEISESEYDVVILEGWCWGARHQTADQLIEPVNQLEAISDCDVVWRRYVNEVLKDNYEPLYELMDLWLMLKAPSFGTVYDWRLEQERKLSAKTGLPMDGSNDLMSPQQIDDFISHYQRITEAILDSLPAEADVVWHLDKTRNIQSIDSNNAVLSF